MSRSQDGALPIDHPGSIRQHEHIVTRQVVMNIPGPGGMPPALSLKAALELRQDSGNLEKSLLYQSL
jgi:hypothetical protein